MPARFIIGRAGTGKTWHCRQQILSMLADDPLGPPILYILPRQATFEAEREIAARAPNGGFCRLRVVSFEQLGHDLLAEVGGAISPVTPQGRRMILGHLLRQNQAQLHFFQDSATRLGLADELDAIFSEFERAGFDPEGIQQILADKQWRTDADDALIDKLRDLQLLHSEYIKFLGLDRIDPQRRLKHIVDSLSKSTSLKSATVFVDAFHDYTRHERQIIAMLSTICVHVDLTVLMDPKSELVKSIHNLPDELSPFHRTEANYRRLYFDIQEAGGKIEKPLLLTEVKRLISPALKTIERQFLTTNLGKSDATGFAMLEAPTRRAELDAAARKIRALMRKGVRLRDIAVLTRDLDSYIDLAEESFNSHGIPFFVDRRRSAGHHPVVQMIRSALLIARDNWMHDDIMQFLRCGLTGFSLAEADELENYVLTHRISGAAWPAPELWNYQLLLTRGSEDEEASPEVMQTQRINDLRLRCTSRLATLVAQFASPAPRLVRENVRDLYRLLDGFNVRGQLISQMKQAEADQRPEDRAETEQVWSELNDLFSEFVDLLGDQPMPLDVFIDVLDRGLENFDLGIAPPAVDQLLIGDVDRTRPREIKVTFLLGLSEGIFPRIASDGVLLSDVERRLLAKKIELDSDARRQLLNERFLAYIAITRASEQLIVSRTTSDSLGRSANPSAFWFRLREIFPMVIPEEISLTSVTDCKHLASLDKVMGCLLRWIRTGPDLQTKTLPALYQWVTAQPEKVEKPWQSLHYTNEASLSSKSAEKLFPSPLHATPAQIESFAACPFQHFSRYGLGLSERFEADVTPADLSRVYHRVLQGVIAEAMSHSLDLATLPPEQARHLIRKYTEQIGQSLKQEIMISSARNRYLLDRIEQNLQQVLQTQSATASRGEFSPRFLGVGFGSGKKDRIPPLTIDTPKKNSVELSGSIDRIDLLHDRAVAMVLDYKFAGGSLSWLRVFHGLSLQLLVYLLVLQSNGEKLAGAKVVPAAAFYAQLLRSLGTVKSPAEAGDPMDPDFHLDPKPRGIFDANYIHSFDKDLVDGSSAVVSAYIKKDQTLGMRDKTDAADHDEFVRMLDHVRGTIAELVDHLIAGDIAVHPYRLNNTSPCSTCSYRSVCRFEPEINRYHHLNSIPRSELFKGGGDE